MSFSVRFMLVLFFLCILSNFLKTGDGACILGVFTIASPSHYILGSSLMKGLAEAGHEVTIVSPFKENDPPKNGKWNEIFLDGLLEQFKEDTSKVNMFELTDLPPFFSIFFLLPMGNQLTERVLSHPKVQQLLKSNEKFDAVIVSQFANDAMKAFANHFDSHLIVFSNGQVNSWINHLIGNPMIPSTSPEVILNFPPRMTFVQRLQNVLQRILVTATNYVYYYPKQNELLSKYFPRPVDLEQVLYNISLVLANSHESISEPQPSVPCVVEIGGFHLKPQKKLPEDLEKYLGEAMEGVIYFSMGSNLKSKDLPVAVRDNILKAFGRRKEKILWKWEDDVLPGQPKNVKLEKWMPQQEILAHPNVKAFITHGGLLSTIETVFHGVPIIAIPIYGDQKMNANSAKTSGYGLVLPYGDITEENMYNFLEEIISNPQYSENVKMRSNIMKDRQVKPMDKAIYWVEYVIRYNGAKHLRLASLDLTWYQYYMVDVFLYILAVIAGFVLALKYLFYFCKKILLKQSKTAQIKNKQKKNK